MVKYIELLDMLKSKSLEWSSCIEELKFGCFYKDWDWWLYRYSDDDDAYIYSMYDTIIWQLTIAWFMEWLGWKFILSWNVISNAFYSITIESWKELWEQSDEVLEQCILLTKKEVWV